MIDDKRFWIWFSMAFSPGNDRIWEFLSQYDDVVSAYEGISSGKAPFMNENERKCAATTHIEQCDSIIEYCEKKGYNIVTFGDENYPAALRNIYNPPAVLFCMGDIGCLNHKSCISCVGTRKASDYSKRVTEKICGELAARDFTVVSGFALGIDSAAHRGALAAGGTTCAVLACGLDVDYPKENASAKKIIAQNGVLLTEYFPGKRPDKFCFHIRNRIISGLSFGTIVAEASEGSGALITANHTADQGKMVFCVPPADIFDKRYSGVIKYLRDGAIPVFSHLDILYEYYTSESPGEPGKGFVWPELSGEEVPVRRTRKKTQKRNSGSSGISNNGSAECDAAISIEEMENLSDEQRIAVNCLKERGALGTESIAEIICMDSMRTLAMMTELEIMGIAELGEDKKYKLPQHLK
ncbi:MAG: DNA-processing protein DprA [Porcipelethomonas sp.]